MLRAYSILAYLFLYGPIMLIVLFSFNSGLSAADFQGFSVKWYAKVAGNSLMLAALQTSLIVAFTSAALATVMGTMAALALQRVKRCADLRFVHHIAIMVLGRHGTAT
jgi:spermidine/putrescine transport system permease protein